MAEEWKECKFCGHNNCQICENFYYFEGDPNRDRGYKMLCYCTNLILDEIKNQKENAIKSMQAITENAFKDIYDLYYALDDRLAAIEKKLDEDLWKNGYEVGLKDGMAQNK